MYIPTAFNVSDLGELHAAMERHSFATLLSCTDDVTEITHLPLLLDRERGPEGTLLGHFARANGHWKLGAEARTTAIFHGPHTYISPTWYGEPNLVPTWNYVAVHAHGRLQLFDDRNRLCTLLGQMVDLYETAQPQPWRLADLDPSSLDKLLSAIVGFELPIERLEGKWKLNQNHPVERRRRVIEQLQHGHSPDDRPISHLMQSTLPPD
jgi:transcriptional regulator